MFPPLRMKRGFFVKDNAMIISRCCNSTIYMHCGQEGVAYYVCNKCDHACDTLFSLSLIKEDTNDAGRKAKTKVAPCTPPSL